MSEQTRSYKVYKIENGTVIDHITSPLALKIIDILKLGSKMNSDSIISLGLNFDSKKTKKKDILKIENVYLTKKETDLIALLSPSASINIIKDQKVIEKRSLEMPKEIKSILKCPNPTCITNKYNDCASNFVIEAVEAHTIIARCTYCERETPILPELVK